MSTFPWRRKDMRPATPQPKSDALDSSLLLQNELPHLQSHGAVVHWDENRVSVRVPLVVERTSTSQFRRDDIRRTAIR
jgi:hypothetical protein